MSINKFIGIGNVGKDPEIKTTQDGKMIANFSIGITETWKEKATGEKKQKTEWVNVSAFGNIVQIVDLYVKKGTKVYIEGKIQTTKYDKEGQTHYNTKVILQGFDSKLELLSSKNSGEAKEIDAHNKAKGNAYVEESEEFISDEVPF